MDTNQNSASFSKAFHFPHCLAMLAQIIAILCHLHKTNTTALCSMCCDTLLIPFKIWNWDQCVLPSVWELCPRPHHKGTVISAGVGLKLTIKRLSARLFGQKAMTCSKTSSPVAIPRACHSFKNQFNQIQNNTCLNFEVSAYAEGGKAKLSVECQCPLK